MKKNMTGFTLIELLIFLIVSGILAGLLVSSYLTVLRNSAVINNQMQASQTAATCMDWYTGERFINGFDSTNLPAGTSPDYTVLTPAFCTAATPSGYNITTKIDGDTTYDGQAGQYKTITVTVTGNTSTTKTGNAILSTIIANY